MKIYLPHFIFAGVATSNKVIIEFEHAFWPSDIGIFLTAVKEDKKRGYMQSWINVHRLIGKPMLATFITGDLAVEFEKQSSDEVKQSGTDLITWLKKSEKLIHHFSLYYEYF